MNTRSGCGCAHIAGCTSDSWYMVKCYSFNSGNTQGIHGFIQLRALHLPVQNQAATKRLRVQQLNLLELCLAAVQRRQHSELHDEAVALRLAVPVAGVSSSHRLTHEFVF